MSAFANRLRLDGNGLRAFIDGAGVRIARRRDGAAGRWSAAARVDERTRRALAGARHGLLSEEAMRFTDSPDHDVVALLDRSGRAVAPLVDILGSFHAPAARERLCRAIELWAGHARWSHGWRGHVSLADAWILDGASARFRHLQHDLSDAIRAMPEMPCRPATATLLLTVTAHAARIATAAIDLCRDHHVLDHVRWIVAREPPGEAGRVL